MTAARWLLKHGRVGGTMIPEYTGTGNSLKGKYPIVLLISALIVWTWSGVKPHDTRLTWMLETAPCFIVLPILLGTYRRFRLTNLTYTLIAIHAMILMVGGHYSYAKVPFGFWMQDWFGWTRNNYDKIGHIMQGFGPAIYAREIVMRTTLLRRGKMLVLFSIAVPMAISAGYEIVEWLAAVSIPGGGSEAFLGTQGYIWDTQTDMFCCLIGSAAAVAVLAGLHNKYLKEFLGQDEIRPLVISL
jgi:putative membrane protein